MTLRRNSDVLKKTISQHGALITLQTAYGLPANFGIVINGVRHSCRSIWRTGTEMGVAFL
jgi:hypothetical protein